MSETIRNIRWALADILSRAANWLRGHPTLDIGYEYRGNRAAQLAASLTVTVSLIEDADEALEQLWELEQLAIGHWWHDRRRTRNAATKDLQCPFESR